MRSPNFANIVPVIVIATIRKPPFGSAKCNLRLRGITFPNASFAMFGAKNSIVPINNGIVTPIKACITRAKTIAFRIFEMYCWRLDGFGKSTINTAERAGYK